MKKFTLLLIVLISTQFLNAQIDSEYKTKFAEADKNFQKGYYYAALPVFLDIYKKAPENANLNFCIGTCYINSASDKTKAIPYLEKAVKSVSETYIGKADEKNSSVYALLYLARAYHLNYQFEEAIRYFEDFQKYIDRNEDPDLWDEVAKAVEISYNGRRIKANPLDIKIDNLGKNINTEYPEYTPVVATDESFLLFTSRREGGVSEDRDKEGKFYEDIWISRKDADGNWGQAELFDKKINTDGHEAIISISNDGKQIFLYRGDEDIYTSTREGDAWTTPVKLPPTINTKGWETHASLSPDGNTLYFTSNRPGGYGGRDIYLSKKQANGTWGKAANLGPEINTNLDEESPCILADGITLYFSSKGHETMGGFDIFISTLSSDGYWSKPENIGYPINSPEDDIFYQPTSDKKHAYYSSARSESYGGNDIYYLTILREKQKQVTYKGNIKDGQSYKPIEATIEIFDKEKNEIIAKLQSDSATGEFEVNLPKGKQYTVTVTAEDYIDFSENFEINTKEDNLQMQKDFFIQKKKEVAVVEIIKEIPLQTDIVLRNVYFDFRRSYLRSDARKELSRLVETMTKVPTMTIEISGHTDNVGPANFNYQLSQWRIESVKAYLVRRGISWKRITTKAYGEKSPATTNDTKEGRAENRRVEFKVTSK
ncbi:MAG: OmpA family protein [Bacteroidetes bacterium]|nr:OmpA family protein [Bacteroidota bacterium]MBU1719622.1 OmpA family protein [Bacteroidota bacterium]